MPDQARIDRRTALFEGVFNRLLHPRRPRGRKGGGEFADKPPHWSEAAARQRARGARGLGPLVPDLPGSRSKLMLDVLEKADRPHLGISAGLYTSHNEARAIGDLHAAGLLDQRWDTGTEAFHYHLTDAGRKALSERKLPKIPRSGRGKYSGVAVERVSESAVDRRTGRFEVILGEAFDRFLHPRVPKRRKGGGQFADKPDRPIPGAYNAVTGEAVTRGDVARRQRQHEAERAKRGGKFPNVSGDEADRVLRPIGSQLDRNTPGRGGVGTPARASTRRKGFAGGLAKGDRYFLDGEEHEVVKAPRGRGRDFPKITARRVKDGKMVELDVGTVVEWPRRKK